MKSALMRITIGCLAFVLLAPFSVPAETKTFIREYTYQASEDDSKNSSRTLALRAVKRLILEELGTYLESFTEVQNFRLSSDQITTLTAGIVQAEIIADKWDGDSLKYWLKAKVVADSDQVIKSIDALRNDRAKTVELESVKKQVEYLLSENQRLRKRLSVAATEQRSEEITAYHETVKSLLAIEWYEKGYALGTPPPPAKREQAINAFTEAINLNPQFSKAYYYRALAHANLPNHRQQEINDYSKAIDIDPEYADAYGSRGMAYADIGDYRQAIRDYSRVVELNPKDDMAYYYRALAYSALGSNQQAIKDYVTAARFGYELAQDYLKSKGINW